MRKIKMILSIILCAIFVSSTFMVSAKEMEYAPYEGYEYNSDNESVAAPVTYLSNNIIDSESIGLPNSFIEANDMYWNGKELFVLDSANGRVVLLDSEYNLIKVISKVTDKNGDQYDFTGAKGLTVASDGTIYIADSLNHRVLVINKDDQVEMVIGQPDTTLVGYDFIFDVTKVMLNNQGKLLVATENVNNGCFVFSKDGEFLNFYGSNTVQRTVDVLLNYIRKKFMTREQIKKLQNYSPATISNFDIDDEGFIYTVARSGKRDTPTVRKLNFTGKDILKVEGIISSYGDLESTRDVDISNNYTSFSDIDVDNSDFIVLLDEGRGKIFEYTQNGQLIAVFGGYGEQIGQFMTPTAIETIGDRILVLDAGTGCIIEYTPTDYMIALRTAFLDLDTSDPEKAIQLWNKVLEYNTNSLYPYYGLGMAYEKLGEYGTAMKYFKLSSTKEEYSDAYHEYRKQVVSENLLIIVLTIVSVILIIFVLSKLIKKKNTNSNGTYSALENKYAFPLYVLLHPADGFQQFKYRKELPSYRISIGIIIAFFFINVIEFFATGYIFNGNDFEDYTIFSTLIGSVVLVALFIIGNWSVCSLLDGNGTAKEIISVTAYSLIPFLVSKIINIVLSNFLTLDEAMVLGIVSAVGILWTALVLIIGLSQIHQYYIGKTILTIFVTLLAMVIVAVIAFLLFSLMQQIIYFFNSIWSEIQLR